MPVPAKKMSAKADDDQTTKVSGSSRAAIEKEPVQSELAAEAQEEKLMAEIRTTAEAADRQALEAIQSTIKDAKRAHFEPDLPPDVEDAGVVSPIKRAEEVVEKGTTIELLTTEQTYKMGLHAKIAGHVMNKVVVGVSSLAAMAIWIGRLLKLAHKHTMRVLFKGGAKNAD